MPKLREELRELYWEEPLPQYHDGAMIIDMTLAIIDRLAAGSYNAH